MTKPFFNFLEAFYGKNMERLWETPIDTSNIKFIEKPKE